MKKTIYILPALALMLFAACSSEDAVTTETKAQLNETPDNAIGFGAYLNRSVTRAGIGEDLDNTKLGTNGFGVFAYYGDGDLYSENLLPNFMYNQKVYNESSQWKYEPVKYWPNEFGSSAISTGVDRVSFFAYAPYVPVTPATGQLTSGDETTGITALTRNGKAGDPYVKYVGIYDPTKCVDLCYGVAAERYTSSVGSSDGTNDIAKGEPFLNVAKPTTGAPLKFEFKHALARLKVTVDADINSITHDETTDLKNMTRVWVRSITFNGIAPKGYLNLHSGYWYDAMDNDKISLGSVTIYDGRRDGLEATASDSYEYPTGLNEDLVQSVKYDATVPGGEIQYSTFSTPDVDKGVTKTAKNLFSTTEGATILVIPANEQLKVTIVYDVETADATLPTYLSDGVTKGSTVENKITKYITIGGAPLKLTAGNSYNLALHLGLNTVEFNAEMGDWTNASAIDDPWLPQNIMTVQSGEIRSVNVPASTTEYNFKVAGLTMGNTITVTPTAKPAGASDATVATTPSPAVVPAGGEVQIGIISMAENETVGKQTWTFTVTDPTSDPTNSIIHIVQLAKAFKPKTANITEGDTFDIETTSGSGTVDGDQWDNATISIQKMLHGTTTYTDLTRKTGAGSPGANEFKYDSASTKGTVTLGTSSVSGDKFRITFKVGEADAVTFELTVS